MTRMSGHIIRILAEKRGGFDPARRSRPAFRASNFRAEQLEERLCPSALTPGLGVYRPFGDTLAIHIDNNRDQVVDVSRGYGASADVAVVGDFSGNTLSSIAAYRPSTGVWFLDRDSNGVADLVVPFGNAEWDPVAGDVDGNGVSDLGIFNRTNGQWQFDTNFDGRADFITGFGGPGQTPLMADFDRDGRSDLVLFRDGTWQVDTNRDGRTNLLFGFGAPGDVPILTDVFGSRDPNLAVFRGEAGGNATWFLDFNRDGNTDTVYRLGVAGDRPLTGFFSTANSIFVNPGGSDNNSGQPFSPLASINTAIARAPAGTFIRLAAGTFRESITVVNRGDLSLVGTGILATVINPPGGDGALVVQSGNISFDNLWLLAPGTLPDGSPARAIVAQGSTVDTRQIRTDGSRQGGLAAPFGGRPASFNATFSQFNSVLTGEGLWLQSGTSAVIRSSTFNNNGTRPAEIPGVVPEGGRGLRVDVGGRADVDNSQFVGNYGGGVIGLDGSDVTIRNSVLSFNRKGNGAIFFGRSTVRLFNNLFEQNGEVRGTVSGLNGVEFFFDFAGSAAVDGNQFKNNTGNGIFASGRNLFFIRNTFDNNQNGIGLQGYSDAAPSVALPTEAVIQNNLFVVSPNRTNEVAIFAIGTAVNASIGGPGVANTFRNYPNQQAIQPLFRRGGTAAQGCPTLNVGANNSENSGTLLNNCIGV